MPSAWSSAELRRRQDRAIEAVVKGQRFRALWRRLMVTTVGEFYQGRIWPKGAQNDSSGQPGAHPHTRASSQLVKGTDMLTSLDLINPNHPVGKPQFQRLVRAEHVLDTVKDDTELQQALELLTSYAPPLGTYADVRISVTDPIGTSPSETAAYIVAALHVLGIEAQLTPKKSA
jgi:hypothetical protein